MIDTIDKPGNEKLDIDTLKPDVLSGIFQPAVPQHI